MKNNVTGLLELETADLECFFGKKHFSPLGINHFITSSTKMSIWKFEVVNGVNKYNFFLVCKREEVA
jgi:hypothetical protein